MAASTVVGSLVSGLYAVPQTVIGGGKAHANCFEYVVTAEIATTSIDEIADIVLLCPVQWSDRITSITIFNDDLDAHATPTLAVDVGLYRVDANTGTVTTITAAAYASAITTLQAANTTGVEIAFEARNIDTIGQTVLTDGSLTSIVANSVPVIGFKVTAAAATAAAGTVTLRIRGVN